MPAVYSPSTSMYSWPSTSHSRQPSPRTTVSGNGALCSVVRVLPPGIASTASCWRAKLLGLRSI